MEYTSDHRLVDSFLNYICNGGMPEIIEQAKKLSDHRQEFFYSTNTFLQDFISAYDNHESRIKELESKLDNLTEYVRTINARFA